MTAPIPPDLVSDCAAGSGSVRRLVGLPAVLDACCGSRMMWFDKADGRALFLDKRRESTSVDTRQGRREIVVDPDLLADFQSLPFDDSSFSLVVFDPPHTFAGPNGWTAKKYGTLKPGWQEEIKAGFAECWRVLCPLGTLRVRRRRARVHSSKPLPAVASTRLLCLFESPIRHVPNHI